MPTALPRWERQPQEPQITQGEDSPKWNKFPNSHYLTSLRERRPPLTGYRARAAVSASQRDFQRGAGCTASARKPGREDCGAPEGAKFRGGPGVRGGLRNLAVTGSFFLLFSSFLARSCTLSLLPRSHPSLLLQPGLRVGSDVTSAEIPPNSSAQWRAGGQPSRPRGGRSRSERSAPAREKGGAGRGDQKRGRGGKWRPKGSGAGSRRSRGERKEREPARALRQERTEPQARALPLWKGGREGRMGRRRRERNLRQTGSSNKSEGEGKGFGDTETYSWRGRT